MLKPANATQHFYWHASYWLTLSAVGLISLLLAIMFFIYPGGHPDPFTPYEPLRPGQPIAALKGYGCQVQALPIHLQMQMCRIAVDDARTFSNILVWTFEGAIQKVTFYGDTLQVVDLIQHFGKPNMVRADRRYYVMVWNGGVVAFAPLSTRRFIHQLQVMFVSHSQKS